MGVKKKYSMTNTIYKILKYLLITFFIAQINLVFTIMITEVVYERNKEDVWAVVLLLLILIINGSTALFMNSLFKKYFTSEERLGKNTK